MFRSSFSTCQGEGFSDLEPGGSYHVIIETELCFRQAFSALGLPAAGQSVDPFKIINVQGFDLTFNLTSI